MSRPASQPNPFWGAIISLGIVLMIIFVFGQLPDNRPASPVPGGYPGPDIPASPTTLPPTASLEAIPSWKATDMAIAQWLATHAPWKLPSAEMEATYAAESTALSRLPPIDKYITSTPGPTLAPATFLQRAAGAGRIVEGLSFAHLFPGFYAINCWIEKAPDK